MNSDECRISNYYNRGPINLNKWGRIIAAGSSSTYQPLAARATLLIFGCLVIVFQCNMYQTIRIYDVLIKQDVIWEQLGRGNGAFLFLSGMDLVGIHGVHGQALCVLMKRALLFYCERIMMLTMLASRSLQYFRDQAASLVIAFLAKCIP